MVIVKKIAGNKINESDTTSAPALLFKIDNVVVTMPVTKIMASPRSNFSPGDIFYRFL